MSSALGLMYVCLTAVLMMAINKLNQSAVYICHKVKYIITGKEGFDKQT